MGWSIGYDSHWKRDIGYGVPAICDHPDCNEKIDRGLSFICGDEPYGGERGCGLFFCSKHMFSNSRCSQLCERCLKRKKPFAAKSDSLEWLYFKMVDPSWAKWRKENGLTPEAVGKKEEWKSLGLVLTPTKCNCLATINGPKIHDVECYFSNANS